MTTGTCGEGSRAVASDEARCTGSLIRQVKSGTFPVQEYWVRTVGLLWLCGLRNVRVAKVVRAAALNSTCTVHCRLQVQRRRKAAMQLWGAQLPRLCERG